MIRKSPEASAILSHPFGNHEKLQTLVSRLAADPKMTFGRAQELLALAANDLGLTQLDIEAAQPDEAIEIPFSADANNSSTYYEDAVNNYRIANRRRSS